MKQEQLLRIENLRIQIPLDEGLLTPVRGVSFSIDSGSTLGLVGESGCGKSLTCREILRVNTKNCKATGKILFRSKSNGLTDLLTLKRDQEAIRKIRGGEITMIYQEPMSAFSPLFTVGNQIVESVLLHVTDDKAKAKRLVIDTMKRVGIAEAERRYDQYPHEFSGGMLQRALIALALVGNPELLLADEPTTALDVTIRAQILDLLQELQKEYGMSILYITHDLGTVAKICRFVAVMYLGKIVEYATVEEIFAHPLHPYTQGLMRSIHKIGEGHERLRSIDGVVPLAMNLPRTCAFLDRCPRKAECCRKRDEPELQELSPGHWVACWVETGGGHV